MKNEEKEICSRCHKDMNKGSNEGGCVCCREHSNQIMIPVERAPDPDNDYDSDDIELYDVTKDEIGRY